ncbi:MAG: tryptophan 2,3-dioxygenase family protein [Phycisphaerales bacterium]
MGTPTPIPPPKPLLYSDYINDRAVVESLLMRPVPAGVDAAQWPRTPDGWRPGDDWPTGGNWCHEEVLFIRTHQAFEVWFALILHELTSVVREAGAMVSGAGGGAVAPVDFAARARAAGQAGLPEQWTAARRVISSAAGTDPAAAAGLGLIGMPGRVGQAAALGPRAGESEEFNHALVRWTQRLRRAAAALLCTLPFFDVLATMTPAEFLRFRDRLQPASGFGSVQFRELELLLGLRELHETKLRPTAGTSDAEPGEPAPPAPMLRPTAQTPGHERATSFYQAQPPWGWERVSRRARESTLRDVVYALLSAAHAAGSRAEGPERGLPDLRTPAVDRFLARALERLIDDQYRGLGARRLDEAGARHFAAAAGGLDAALQHRETLVAAFIEMHPEQERFAQFLEACLEMDGALLRWRDRHIRFVEAIIGMRRGTGGGGISYLRTTTAAERGPQFTLAFPCLWQARSFVQGS